MRPLSRLKAGRILRKIKLKDQNTDRKYPKIDDLDRWKLSRRRRVTETNPWRCTATKGKGYPGLSKETWRRGATRRGWPVNRDENEFRELR